MEGSVHASGEWFEKSVEKKNIKDLGQLGLFICGTAEVKWERDRVHRFFPECDQWGSVCCVWWRVGDLHALSVFNVCLEASRLLGPGGEPSSAEEDPNSLLLCLICALHLHLQVKHSGALSGSLSSCCKAERSAFSSETDVMDCGFGYQVASLAGWPVSVYVLPQQVRLEADWVCAWLSFFYHFLVSE